MVSILLLLVFLFPYMAKVWVIVDFKINQDFIAKVLCVKKDEPINKCNGKCHLAKQLKKTEHNDASKAPLNIEEKVELLLFIEINSSNSFKHTPFNFNKFEFYHSTILYLSTYTTSIFHPPQ